MRRGSVDTSDTLVVRTAIKWLTSVVDLARVSIFGLYAEILEDLLPACNHPATEVQVCEEGG